MVKSIAIPAILISIILLMAAVAQRRAEWPIKVYYVSGEQLDSMCIELGRALFYDPILSRDSTISCASCHSSYVAFTHVDHKVSHGIDDRVGIRNAPALMNLAWSPVFMWDGAINHLEMQPLAPITNSTEMDEQLPRALAKLQRSPLYSHLFREVFGDSLVTTQRMLRSFAAFLVTLESRGSKYDAVNRGEAIFSEQEQRGYNLFRKQCNSCHSEPLFTNYAFRSNGIEPVSSDFGRGSITGIPSDSGMFKVPTLRNILYTRPYMHDGRFERLNDVVEHYAAGHFSKGASEEMDGVKPMSEEERIDLTAFLLTLSDSAFVFDKRFQYPFKLYERFSVQHR
jgi:cytochrome c peroxidase